MNAQEFIANYGLEYARSVNKGSCLWDMYFNVENEEYTSHKISEHCVYLGHLHTELLKHRTYEKMDYTVLWLFLGLFLTIWWLI